MGNRGAETEILPRLVRDTVGAYALSEANSGSDAFALATRAREDGDHFILNGRKLWITNAKEAGLFIRLRQRESGGGLSRDHGISS